MLTLNWHPCHTNPLDYLDYRYPHPLVTPNGVTVKISQKFPGFIITIGDKQLEAADNLIACYILNTHEVGIKEDQSARLAEI